MCWCRLPVLLCFHGLFLRVSSESFFAYIYIYIHTYIYISLYTMMSAGEKRKGEKGRRTEKKKKNEWKWQRGWFPGFYISTYTDFIPRVFPASERYCREESVGRDRASTQPTQTILIHASHTYTHIDQSKQGPRDYVWAGNYDFAWSTCLRRSTIDSAPIILHRSFTISVLLRRIVPPSKLFLNPSRFPARPRSLFLLSFYSHDDYSRVLVYIRFISIQSLSIFLFPTFLSLRQFPVHATAIFCCACCA